MAGDALLVTLVCFVLLILAYIFYGRFLARRIFQLDPNRKTPAHRFRDGVDYIPTKIPVLFGHHFASIAGLGPILGPALAVIWGWVPAVLWVVIGCIFLGAVHDLGALTVSMRFRGRSIGDVCRELIGPRARLLFLIIIFFAMSLAMGAFVNAISGLFIMFNPDAIIPSFGLMLVAVCMGVAVYKFNVPLLPATVIGVTAFGGLIALGAYWPVPTYDLFVTTETQHALDHARQSDGDKAPVLAQPYGGTDALRHFKKVDDSVTVTSSLGLMGTPMGQGALTAGSALYPDRMNTEVYQDLRSVFPSPTQTGPVQTTWIWILLAYGFGASVLPVWLLLQPRDYINSFQLYFALAFLLLGLIVATGVEAFSSSAGENISMIHAGAVRQPVSATPEDVKYQFQMTDDVFRPVIPFLFVTIACGAVSGFHSLVSSGTTVRQINRETDALPIGYGGMLTEGALAILVIMACVAGLGAAGWSATSNYASWGSISGGLAPQLSAVVSGGANFLRMLGIPVHFGQTFLAVTIVAFALTTLDSATRLLRFNVEELFRSIRADALTNRYLASFIAICGIALFALVPGGKILWILFGTVNQLLAGLTLLTVSIFLFKLRRPVVYTIVPMSLMLTVTVWAMLISLQEFWLNSQWLLFSVALGMLLISLWMLVEAALSFARGRGGVAFEDEMSDEKQEEMAATSV